jgi:glycosyltransferase involved in cell wall biosynthesis
MRIRFYIPPESQRVGGLDLAIRTLLNALQENGLDVATEPFSIAEADLVHFHGIWQPRFFQIAKQCRAANIPYVVSPHGMLEPWAWRHKWWKKWAYFLLRERLFLKNASGLLATSSLEKCHLSKFRLGIHIGDIGFGLPEKIGPGYAKARKILGWRNDEFILLYLSRIHPKKGLHLLLEALRRLGLHDSSLRLVIVGDGDSKYFSQVKKFAQTNAQELPTIQFEGPIWDARKWVYLQGADLFCLPTYSENFGLAILEACQVGTPVLTTTATPWTPFLVQHRLPVAEPDLESLCSALTQNLAAGKRSEADRKSLATAARTEFDWTSISQKYSTFYQGVLSNKIQGSGPDGRA